MKIHTLIRRLFGVVAVLSTSTSFISAQNLLNGSFESGINPGIDTGLFAVNSTSIDSWTLQTGSVDYIGTRWLAGDGSRSLDMSGISAGSIFQNVGGFSVGQSYRLSFLLAGNPGAGPAVKTLQASIGSSSQTYTFDITGFTPDNMGWSQRQLDFTATSVMMNLTFSSLTAGNAGAALDGVSITAVPEPRAVSLGIVALCLAVFARTGRRVPCANISA